MLDRVITKRITFKDNFEKILLYIIDHFFLSLNHHH